MTDNINNNLDPTPLPPNNLVAKDPQSAELARYVRSKSRLADMREAIARSIELNSTRSTSAEILASETVNVSNDLTDRFNQQIGALTEDSEVIDARGGKATLGQRLDETDAQLAQNTSTKQRRAIITIETDDAKIEDYTVILPLLNSKGVVATTAVPPAHIGQDGYMSWSQIHELVDKHGWSVESHTVDQFNLVNAQIGMATHQLTQSKRLIEEQGLKCDHLSYPNGGYNETVMKVAKKVYKSAGTIHPGINKLPVKSVVLNRTKISAYGLSHWKKLIDELIAEKGWLIIYTHGIEIANNPSEKQLLSDVIDYAQSKFVEFMNHDDAWDEVGNVIDLGMYGSREIENNFVLSKTGDYAYNGIRKSEEMSFILGQNNITPDAPIDYFAKGKITYNQIEHAGADGFPENKPGTLVTDRIIRWDGYVAQEYYVYNENKIYTRKWVSGSNPQWSDWYLISSNPSEGLMNVENWAGTTIDFSTHGLRKQPDADYMVLLTANWNCGALWVTETFKNKFSIAWETPPVTSGKIAFKVVR